jgi:hypothetical protein
MARRHDRLEITADQDENDNGSGVVVGNAEISLDILKGECTGVCCLGDRVLYREINTYLFTLAVEL